MKSGWMVLAFYALSTLDFSTSERGVCYSSVNSTMCTHEYTMTSIIRRYRCGFFGWDRCRRTESRKVSRRKCHTMYKSEFGCCSGYHQVETSTCQKIGEVRLVGGVSAYEGRVEVFLNGQWGTVCGDGWSSFDAKVVCRQLGYSNSQFTPQAFHQAHFGRGSVAIVMDNVHCSGTETRLTSCTHITNHNCGHHEDAGVRCPQCTETNLRLRGGSSPLEGRVEVCLGGGWGTVCDDGWDTSDATVVCHQLTFNINGATAFSRAYFGQGAGLPIAMDNVRCSSSETHLVNCSYLNASAVRSCSHSEDAGVRCLPLPPRTAPSRVTVAALSSTSLRVSWVSPVAGDWNGQMTGFKITIRNIESSTASTITVSNSAATSHTRSFLHPYYRYECRVAAYNTQGTGPFSSSVTRQLPQDRPSGIPQNVRAMVHSSRSFSLSWSPPLAEERNGIIRQYTVQTTSAGQNFLTQTTRLNLMFPTGSVRVVPHRTYILQVAAETTVGRGPYSPGITVNTGEDLPGAVNNFMLVAINATTLRAAWQEPLQPNGIITDYQLTFEDLNSIPAKHSTSHTTASREFTWIALHPYYNYAISVAAVTSVGRGTFTRRQIRMPEAAPSGPPLSVNATATDPKTLILTWELPEEEHRNGRIRRYDITLLPQDGDGEMRRYSTQSMRLQVPNLHPYYTYTLVVSAVTITTGPSANVTLLLPEDAPSQVPLNFSATHKTANLASIDLTWSAVPLEHHNGVIRGYRVTAHPSSGPGESLNVNVTSDLEEFQLSGLSANTLYNISIAAFTTAGTGPSATLQILLLPQVPTSVEVTRVSATEIHINWITTNAETYFVQYHPVNDSQWRHSVDEKGSVAIVETSQTSFQITGLSPVFPYAVSVASGNEAGRGNFSEEIVAGLFDSSSFILHLSGVVACEQWLVNDADTKLRAMLQVISSQLMLNYSSSLVLNHVTQTHLSCQMDERDVVILQGTLVGTAEKSGAELHQMLQEWVDQGQTFQITNTPFKLLDCSTYPEFETSCELEPVGAALYGGMGGGVVFLMIIVTLIIAVLVVISCKRKNLKFTDRINLIFRMDTISKVDDPASKELEAESKIEPIYESIPAKRPHAPPEDLSQGGNDDPHYTYIQSQDLSLLKKNAAPDKKSPNPKCSPQQAEDVAHAYDYCLPKSTATRRTTRKAVDKLPQVAHTSIITNEAYSKPQAKPKQKPTDASDNEPLYCPLKVQSMQRGNIYQKVIDAMAKPTKLTDISSDQKAENMQEDGADAQVKSTASADASDHQRVYIPLKPQSMQKSTIYQKVMDAQAKPKMLTDTSGDQKAQSMQEDGISQDVQVKPAMSKEASDDHRVLKTQSMQKDSTYQEAMATMNASD